MARGAELCNRRGGGLYRSGGGGRGLYSRVGGGGVVQ